MKIFIKTMQILTFICILLSFSLKSAHSFVGAFISKDGSKITNQNSKVILARKDKKTIITFTGDFYTKTKDFILIVPIPAKTTTPRINTIDYELIKKLDLYTSPRLIEYINFDPCNQKSLTRPPIITNQSFTTIDMDKAIGLSSTTPKTTTDHHFTILTLKESKNIDTWLQKHGYKLLPQYFDIFKEYIAKQMKFILIEVKNLDNEITQLAPIQIEYESEKFMVTTKIGTINAPSSSNQNMNLYLFSNQGEVGSINYKIKDMPYNIDLPSSVVNNFNQFYNSLTLNSFISYPNTIFKEYAWPMSACKPCTSPPLTVNELQKMGIFWYKLPEPGKMGLVAPFSAIYITRLRTIFDHVHNSIDDIELKETTNKIRYQTFFNIKYPISMTQSKCGNNYSSELQKAENIENKNLYTAIH